jgi:ribosomal protein S12 methylthiotransferase accessory factor
VKIKSLIKSCDSYPDKLFHPRRTIKNCMIALRRLKPPFLMRLRRIDYLDRLDIPVYESITGEKTKKAYPADSTFTHRCYGKGKSTTQARASAVMELVERFSCQHFFANADNVRLQVSGGINNRSFLEDIRATLPEQFKNDRFILDELKVAPFRLVKAFSLTRNKDILFPSDFFHTTTGFASGNCIEEAILHGVCECLERHRIAVVSEGRLSTPLIDVDSIDVAEAREIISRFNRAGVKLFIKDFSGGFKIPTIGILSYDSGGRGIDKIYCIAGTSLNREIALVRALTEVAQQRSQVLHEKVRRKPFGFPLFRSLKDARHFTNSEKIIRFSELPSCPNKDFKVEVETAVKELHKKGHEIIVIVATHPVLKIPTVIVAIPWLPIPLEADNPYEALARLYAEGGMHCKGMQIREHFVDCYAAPRNRKRILLECGLYRENAGEFKHAIKMYKNLLVILNPNEKKMRIYIYKALARCYVNLQKPDKLAAVYCKLKSLAC